MEIPPKRGPYLHWNSEAMIWDSLSNRNKLRNGVNFWSCCSLLPVSTKLRTLFPSTLVYLWCDTLIVKFRNRQISIENGLHSLDLWICTSSFLGTLGHRDLFAEISRPHSMTPDKLSINWEMKILIRKRFKSTLDFILQIGRSINQVFLLNSLSVKVGHIGYPWM